MAKLERMPIAEAKQQAADWEAQHEQHLRDAAIATRFKDASASDLIGMWESGKNEQGRKLSQFEFAALCERWIEVFRCLPPEDDEAPNGVAGAQTTSPEPDPDDDTMLRLIDVVRLTGISSSTIKRMVIDKRFPPPMRLSPRRIGWPAREVKSWLRQLDDQRRSPRQ